MGIVVDEQRARASNCLCYKLDDSLLCFSKGIIGGLSDVQEREYCPSKIVKPPTRELKERYQKFVGAVHRASKRYAREDHDIKKWLETVSEEMRKTGLEV